MRPDLPGIRAGPRALPSPPSVPGCDSRRQGGREVAPSRRAELNLVPLSALQAWAAKPRRELRLRLEVKLWRARVATGLERSAGPSTSFTLSPCDRPAVSKATRSYEEEPLLSRRSSLSATGSPPIRQSPRRANFGGKAIERRRIHSLQPCLFLGGERGRRPRMALECGGQVRRHVGRPDGLVEPEQHDHRAVHGAAAAVPVRLQQLDRGRREAECHRPASRVRWPAVAGVPTVLRSLRKAAAASDRGEDEMVEPTPELSGNGRTILTNCAVTVAVILRSDSVEKRC